MFDYQDHGIGLLPGEGPESVEAEDRLAYEVTCREMADGWVEDSRHRLPDLESVTPGPFLAVVLEAVDRSKLNGFDLVKVLKARERMVGHFQAASQQDMVEISRAAHGDASSEPERLAEAFEYASDEIRAALTLTRRAADTRLDYASDMVARLPQVLGLLDHGDIDWPKARVFVDGTAHLCVTEARSVLGQLADVAPKLTTGQLRARIRKLAVEVDPEESVKRYEQKLDERRLWIEPTDDGTANLFLLDIPLVDAQVIRNRVHRRLISLPKAQRGDRTVAQLRADIAVDLLKGHDPGSGTGKGFVDLRTPLSTLAGLDDQAGWLDGIEPVVSDIAVRSPTYPTMQNGGSRSPTTTGPSSISAPPAGDPPNRCPAWCRVCSPHVRVRGAVFQPANAISTISNHGCISDPPPTGTAGRNAVTTTR